MNLNSSDYYDKSRLMVSQYGKMMNKLSSFRPSQGICSKGMRFLWCVKCEVLLAEPLAVGMFFFGEKAVNQCVT